LTCLYFGESLIFFRCVEELEDIVKKTYRSDTPAGKPGLSGLGKFQFILFRLIDQNGWQRTFVLARINKGKKHKTKQTATTTTNNNLMTGIKQ